MKKQEVQYLKTLCRSMYDLQQVRIQMGNRLVREGKEEETITDEAMEVLKNHASEVERVEKEFTKSIKKELKLYPIWSKYLEDVRGCGPVMAGVVISEIQDIARFSTISKLWSYFGYGLKDNEVQKKRKGEKANWNSYGKSKLHVLAECFLRSGNKEYRKLYDDYRHRIKTRKCNSHIGEKGRDEYGCTDGHRHAMTMRYVIKMFLKNLFLKWYELEGITPRLSYQEEYLGHTHNK